MEAQTHVRVRQFGSTTPPAHSIIQSQSPPPSNASSSDSSSTATAPSQPRPSVPDTTTTTAQSTPSNDAIEAAIRAATTSSTASSSPRSSSSVPSIGKASGTSDGRTVPPRDTRTQLYVGNLPYRVRWQDLKDLFRRAGTVLRADVSLGPDNRSRGYGTVLLATAEDAGRAIDMFNGYEWQSRILEVRVDRIGGPMTLPGEPGMQGMAMQASMMPPGVSMMTSNNLYLNNSPQASRGSILSPAPPFGGHQQTASTYAFQNQQTSSQSHQIFSPQPQTLSLSQLHAQLQAPSQFEQLQQQYQGHQQQQQPPSIPGRTLFVGNLPYHVQWQDLKDLFRRTPGGVTVLRADVALGPDGRSKGFGTVTLRTEEETERAKRWFSGYEFNGRQLKVHHDRVPLSSNNVLLQHLPSPIISSASAIHPSSSNANSPHILSHSMAMLNFGGGDPMLTAQQRPTSPSPTSSSSSSSRASRAAASVSASASQGMRLRSEPSTTSSMSGHRSVSSPMLIRQPQREQGMLLHQPSPLHSALSSVELTATALSTSSISSNSSSRLSLGDPGRGNASGGGESSTSRHRDQASSTASPSVSPPHSTSPSMSRANRPTHIALPPPSFNCDFDPSLEEMDSAYVDGDEQHHHHQNESGLPEQQQQQQTTPLQLHYRRHQQQQFQQQREREGTSTSSTTGTPSATGVRHQQQLYQLLHGSRQLAAGAGGTNSPKPHQQLPKLSTTTTTTSSSTATSSVPSAASSTASLFETPERMGGHQYQYGPTGLRESHSSGASSAAGSTKSLPLGLGSGGGAAVTAGGAIAPSSSSSSSSKPAATVFSRDTSPGGGGSGKSGTRRPLSTVSTSGSATSASDNNSSSTSFTSSSRTGSGSGSSGAGVFGGEGNGGSGGSGDLDASEEGWLNTAGYLEKERRERERERNHPHHPGSIPLPGFSSSGTDVSESGMGTGLFQQYYPFAKIGSDQEGGASGGGFVEFGGSGEPTVQARPVHTEDQHEVHAHSSTRREPFSAAQSEMPHYPNSSKKDVPGYFQPPQAPLHHAAYPPMHPMPQLTPHGLPPMTPSMPPFTFVGSQPPYLSPGMYAPTSPIGPGGTSHFQLRQQRMQQSVRSRPHPNAPGTLSLPPQQQFVFVPHQQSPMISPTSTIGPGTGPGPTAQMSQVPSYLQPLGSPGSPYALGPHHPLHHTHHQQHPYHHHPYAGHPPPPPLLPPPHPLSNSFGGAAGHHVPAMSPGAVGLGLAAMSPGAPWGKPGQMMKPYVNAAVGAPVRRNNNRRSSRSRSRSKEQAREEEEEEEQQQQQHQQHYYPHPAGGGGYWGYAHHSYMSGAEPKGYFDQLYMGPGGEDGGGGDTSEGGESQSVIEREIMKDRTGEGQRQGSYSTKSTTEDRTGLCQSTSSSPEDAGFAGEQHEGKGELVPPPFQHANTYPVDVEGPVRSRISRSFTGGDEL